MKMWLAGLAVGLALTSVLQQGALLAQTATFTYDPAGNPTAVNPGPAQPPAIAGPLRNQLVGTDGSVTFSVAGSGTGLSYQWLSNGVPIAGATSDSLTLSGLKLSGTNLGYFSVILRNPSGSVTSSPAALWPDVNGNGIPDWWEMFYFGNLNQSATEDFDHDGVNNFNEYVEGTNPTNAASFNPRLTIETAHGTVSVTPSQPFYTKGQLVSLKAFPDAGHEFSSWSGSVSGNKPQITVVMDTNKAISASFGFPLAVALDSTNRIWTTGGDALWFGQAEVSQDGVASAQSGPIVSYWNGQNFTGQQTWLQTVVQTNQQAQVSFWWNVSSRPPDALAFGMDGVALASLSGEAVGWQFFQTNISAGTHTLTWTYTKGPVDIPTGVPFADSGWVDQFSYVGINPQNQLPLLAISSANNSVLISWDAPSTGFVLQQTSVLQPALWTSVTNPVQLVNARNQVTISPGTSALFYRLSK
ncbi:MAG TPA: hypothetical protein VKY92_26140 [Verrucomicrobiae bacterium]|nr:hypothetical protein [Verrucomicrobiae bacterium]